MLPILMKWNKVFTIFALFLLSLFLLANAKYVHRKSRVPGVKRVLKGFIRSDPIKDTKGLDTKFRRVADMETELFSDVVILDETEEDDFKIVNCRYLWKRKHYDLAIRGKDADKTDFDVGTSFIISRKVWKEYCPGVPLNLRSIPRQEQTLFFNITSCTEVSKRKIRITMVQTKRRKVIGEVKYKIRNSLFNQNLFKKRVNFLKNIDDLGTSRSLSLSQNVTIPSSSRESVSFDESYTLTISSGITATVTVSATAGVENVDGNFDVFGGISAGLTFETFVTISASATLSIAAKESLEYSYPVLDELPIPSLSYGLSIPTVGDLAVGAFFAIDFVASLEAALLATYTASVEFEKRVSVSLELYPDASADADILTKTGSGSSALETTSEADIGATITGFVGVEPAIAAGISLAEVGSGSARVSAQAGLEASISTSETPNSPITSGITFGSCDECHFVQGSLSAVGKDLRVGYDLFGEEDSLQLASVLFETTIGSICAITTPCV